MCVVLWCPMVVLAYGARFGVPCEHLQKNRKMNPDWGEGGPDESASQKACAEKGMTFCHCLFVGSLCACGGVCMEGLVWGI